MKKFTSLKLFVCAALMAFAGTMQAASTTVTFDFSTADGVTALGLTMPDSGAYMETSSMTITNGAISVNTTDGSTASRIWNTGKGSMPSALRIYSGGTLKLTVSSGAITAVTMTAASKNNFDFTSSPGDFTIDGTTGTWSGSAASITFTPASVQNRIRTIVVTYDTDATPTDSGETGGDDPAEPTVAELPYSEALTSSFGTMTTNNATIWTIASNYSCAKATGYKKGDNSANFEGSAVLYTPWLNVKDYDEVTLAFDNCINAYFNDLENEATLYVYTSETDSTQLTFTYPDAPSSGWSEFVSSSTDVACADAEQIRFGWVYTSSSSSAGTWELRNVSVSAEGYVAPPTFSPEAGTYTDMVEVTISAGEDCTIYYTIDGTEPTTSSATYTEAIVIDETTTVKAIAEDVTGELSEVATAEYIIVGADTVSLDYSEDFANGIGTMTNGNDKVWKKDSYNGTNYMKGSGYLNGANANVEEAIIATPWLDLTNVSSATLSFDHCIGFFRSADPATFLKVWVGNSGDLDDQLEITFPTVADDKNWSSFEACEVDLTQYCGQVVRIVFDYNSTTETAGTWEIANVKVTGQTETGINEVKFLSNDARAYDLQGRRVAQPTKGFYIINGQKVLMK